MSQRVTVGDIAKALGLSRNTVSKALNGGKGITDATRQRVLRQAIDMNYKMLGAMQEHPNVSTRRNILLVCRDNQLTNPFFGPLILELQQLVRDRDAAMTLQFMSVEEVANGVIPEALVSADGVIGLEILDKAYMSSLLRQGKPCVFFDGDWRAGEIDMPFDLVLEDDDALYRLICQLIDGGIHRLGFVGDPEHCKGFRDRYNDFELALYQHGLSDEYSILFHEQETQDFTRLFRQLLQDRPLPEVYVCANTFVAKHIEYALENLSIRVPEQVRLVAFGAVSESHCRLLASVVTDRKSIASALVLLLFDRMARPDINFRKVMTASRIEWDTTND